MVETNADELKARGNKAFADKKYEEATELYTKAIQIEATNHVFFSNRSASHAGQEKWDKAIEDAKECVRLDPSFLKGYYRLATAQIGKKDFSSALTTIRQGLAIDAEHPQLQNLIRVVQQNQKRAANTHDSADSSTIARNHSNVVLDEATQKELNDLQTQHVQTSRELGLARTQLHSTQRLAKMAELTRSELQTIPEDAKCYRSVGKAFLRWASKDQVIEHMKTQNSDFEKQSSESAQKIEYLEKRIKSQRQNMDELVASVATSGASAKA